MIDLLTLERVLGDEFDGIKPDQLFKNTLKQKLDAQMAIRDRDHSHYRLIFFLGAISLVIVYGIVASLRKRKASRSTLENRHLL